MVFHTLFQTRFRTTSGGPLLALRVQAFRKDNSNVTYTYSDKQLELILMELTLTDKCTDYLNLFYWNLQRDRLLDDMLYCIDRGHCEGGPTARSKNFKTPFFKRY